MSNQVESPDGEASARTYQQVSEVLQQCASRCREMDSTQQQQMQVLVEVVQNLWIGAEPWRGKSARAFEDISWNKVGENFSGLALALQWGAETLEKMALGLEARGEVRGQVERMQRQQSQQAGMTEGARAAFEQGLTEAMNWDMAAKWRLVGLVGTLSEQLEVAAGQVGSCSTGKHRGSWPLGGPGDGSLNHDDGSGKEPVPETGSNPDEELRTRIAALFEILFKLMQSYELPWPRRGVPESWKVGDPFPSPIPDPLTRIKWSFVLNAADSPQAAMAKNLPPNATAEDVQNVLIAAEKQEEGAASKNLLRATAVYLYHVLQWRESLDPPLSVSSPVYRILYIELEKYAKWYETSTSASERAIVDWFRKLPFPKR